MRLAGASTQLQEMIQNGLNVRTPAVNDHRQRCSILLKSNEVYFLLVHIVRYSAGSSEIRLTCCDIIRRASSTFTTAIHGLAPPSDRAVFGLKLYSNNF